MNKYLKKMNNAEKKRAKQEINVCDKYVHLCFCCKHCILENALKVGHKCSVHNLFTLSPVCPTCKRSIGQADSI
jgi:hypothetical protein